MGPDGLVRVGAAGVRRPEIAESGLGRGLVHAEHRQEFEVGVLVEGSLGAIEEGAVGRSLLLLLGSRGSNDRLQVSDQRRGAVGEGRFQVIGQRIVELGVVDPADPLAGGLRPRVLVGGEPTGLEQGGAGALVEDADACLRGQISQHGVLVRVLPQPALGVESVTALGELPSDHDRPFKLGPSTLVPHIGYAGHAGAGVIAGAGDRPLGGMVGRERHEAGRGNRLFRLGLRRGRAGGTGRRTIRPPVSGVHSTSTRGIPCKARPRAESIPPPPCWSRGRQAAFWTTAAGAGDCHPRADHRPTTNPGRSRRSP